MRIRKNAKISPLLYTNSTINLSAHSNKSLLQESYCQLNQSPWDIITFPPQDSSSPPLLEFGRYEVHYNVNPAGNGPSVDPVPALKSISMVPSKTSFDDKAKNANASAKLCNKETNGLYEKKKKKKNKKDFDRETETRIGFKEGSGESVKEDEKNPKVKNAQFSIPFQKKEDEKKEEEEEIVLCSKTDGKGWQCGRLVKPGNTMCDDHIAQLQNYAVWTAKKKSRPIAAVTGPKAESRPRRTKKRAAAADPNEFYFYSGFGPLWGKKRGAAGRAQDSKGTTCNAYGTTTAANSPNNSKGTTSNAYGTTGSTTTTTANGKNVYESSSTSDDMDDEEVKIASLLYELDPEDVGLDYDDEEDDDDEEEEEEEGKKKAAVVGKKRGRKPIKARSLKSLM